tara:strand:- start:6802 stop:7257 length:456 start_codon:yes stop_codon:yes gene_type:complete
MRLMYDTRDLSYSDDGDILFDLDRKDFKVIDDSEGKISSETMAKRIFSNPGDWKRMPEYGSGILSLVGNDTAENIISLIKSAVTDELTKEMAFNSSEFEVKVIPLSLREYAVVVILQKGYMKQPIIVSSNISSNYFSNKNSGIPSIGIGVK